MNARLFGRYCLLTGQNYLFTKIYNSDIQNNMKKENDESHLTLHFSHTRSTRKTKKNYLFYFL